MNGKPGDDPITDIVKWKRLVFSKRADELITEIVELGAEQELKGTFNLFHPPPLDSFEISLRAMRDRVLSDRKKRGWEV